MGPDMSEWLGVSWAPWSFVELLWLGFILSVGFATASGWPRVVAGSLKPSEQDFAVEFLARRFAEGELDPETDPAQRAALVRIVAVDRDGERILDHDGSST